MGVMEVDCEYWRDFVFVWYW